MNKVVSVVALSASLASILGLGACDRNLPDAAQSAVEKVPGEAANRPAVLASGTVVMEVQAGEDRMGVSAGEKVDGKVTASGAAGALIFGPYVPLSPGRYSLLVEGTSSTPFGVDVVHNAGSNQIAAQQYNAPSGGVIGSGSLAVLDFEVTEAIENAEFRVVVPDGADTVVSSYKVVTR